MAAWTTWASLVMTLMTDGLSTFGSMYEHFSPLISNDRIMCFLLYYLICMDLILYSFSGTVSTKRDLEKASG